MNQPCDDDDGRSTVSTVPLPLAHVVARSFLARRSIRAATVPESLSRKNARRGGGGGGRRGSPLPFPTKIADESSLALSPRLVSFGRVSPGITSRCQVVERKREEGVRRKRDEGRGAGRRREADVRSRTFRVAGNIVGDRRNGWSLVDHDGTAISGKLVHDVGHGTCEDSTAYPRYSRPPVYVGSPKSPLNFEVIQPAGHHKIRTWPR